MIELWGSSGAGNSQNRGDRGSYVAGRIDLDRPKVFYLYIGHAGRTDSKLPPFNGGGAPSQKSIGSGGGCTDIRLKKGKSFESLKSRIIVAGSGGSFNSYPPYPANGGDAGLVTAPPGNTNGDGRYPNSITAAEGGQKNKGGKSSSGNRSDGSFVFAGQATFGKGCNGDEISGLSQGGGCGYFGGGAGADGNCIVSSSAGGSSYISGVDGFLAIDPSSTSDSNYKMKSDSVHSSNLIFYDSSLKSGGESMPSPFGGNKVGHTGNGFIRISSSVNFVKYLNVNPDLLEDWTFHYRSTHCFFLFVFVPITITDLE